MMRQFRYRAVILSYFFFTEYLLFSGEISRFIAPGFAWLSYVTVVLLGVFLFFAQRGAGEGPDAKRHKETHENLRTEMAKLVLLIFPVLLFFLVKPVAITDLNTLAIKPLTKKDQSVGTNAILYAEEDGFVHVNLYGLSLIADNEPLLLTRYKFKTIGRVSKLSAKKLTLQRILITCCAADAQPVEINVAVDSSGPFKKGEWLQIKGKAELREGILTFMPDSIGRIPKPDEFYMSLYDSIPKMSEEGQPSGNRP
ncbi:MAG: TIGR03943 family protein [Nitrospirae bacterium]|nr:TIGR03943 family protein [Nitrospirota bacterium]